MVLAEGQTDRTWNRIEDPEVNLPKYAQFLTKVQNQFSGRKIAFVTNGAAAIMHPWRE